MEHPPVTYQQLLAQQYEENARDLLVYQQTNYENVEGDDIVEEHNAQREVGQVLEDQHEFRQFAGARNSEQIILKPQPFEDKGISSIRRAKDVKNHIFNIDSRFRPYAVGGILPTTSSLIASTSVALTPVGNEASSSSHFVFPLDSQYKNIISAELTKLQIPNKFFNLVDNRNNYYIYTKKGANGTNVPFLLPVASIASNVKNTYTVIQLSVNISPLVAEDSITLSDCGIYDGTYTVVSSTNSTVTISYQAKAPVSPLSGILSVLPNASNSLAGFTRVGVYITSVNQNPRATTSPVLTEPTTGQTGFYYTNTSIFPALNTAFANIGFSDIQFKYLDGFCNIVNSSESQTYTINLTPETNGIEPAYFPTLGAMLGFYNYVYEIHSSALNNSGPCNINCAQISYCSAFGSLMSENKVDMNADTYIQIAIQNWENVLQQDGENSYYGVFQNIPINVQKGDMIYDTIYNNSITKKYDFLQPTNVRYLEIYLYDRLGNPLLMPGIDWSMALELEEVLNSGLYDKLREL